jgi:hypothetical protein
MFGPRKGISKPQYGIPVLEIDVRREMWLFVLKVMGMMKEVSWKSSVRIGSPRIATA